MNFIEGGVCAARGFRAAGIHVGVKTHAAWKKDLALIVSDTECAAAAVFTSLFTFGTTVVYDGNTVGVVSDEQSAAQAISAVPITRKMDEESAAPAATSRGKGPTPLMSTQLPAMLHTFTSAVMHMMTFMWAPARRKAEKVSISAWRGSAAAVMTR